MADYEFSVDGPGTRRADYAHHRSLPTRWQDNDAYGHVNNVVYYSFFDTAVTAWLIEDAGIDPYGDATIGLCVASNCDYRAPLRFPEVVEAGIRADRVGRASVTYGVGLFRAGEDTAAATGTFVHVYVERESRESVEIPARLRAALAGIAPPQLAEPERRSG